MLKLKAFKNKLNYRLIILAKQKNPWSGKIFKKLGIFNSKLARLNLNLIAYWIKDIHFTNKTKRIIIDNTTSFNNVKVKYKIKNEKI